ncbi:hypothetical protein B566_EDAN013920 [Ephemera danica]|nr:hypothetical protein B566_EDAN013920 [Ephemera danica]
MLGVKVLLKPGELNQVRVCSELLLVLTRFMMNLHLLQTASRDSDSLIQDTFSSGIFDPSKSCWKHPKIRENWKMVLAAVILLLIGVGLLTTGFLAACLPIEGLQAAVFFIAGAICFIPGAYHVVYIYLAVKGWRGFDFYHLPLFN